MINQEDTDLIDLYVTDKLTGESLDAFNKRVKTDEEFAKEVEFMMMATGAIKEYGRDELRSKIRSIAAKKGNKKQRSKRKMYWSIAASLLLLLGLSGVYYLFIKPAGQQFVFNNVMPPFKQADIKYTEYSVAADKGAVISYHSGTIITIPKDAFIDKKGEVIKGNISVKYREMSSPEELFIAGIPMSYDSSGNSLNLQTAGVCELLAFKDDSIVDINPRNTINIDLSSSIDRSGYNLLLFDTISRNWLKKGQDSNLVKLDDYKTPADAVDNLVPRKHDHSKRYFKLVFRNPAKFPEFAEYRNYIFEVPDNEKNFKGDEMLTNWNSTTLVKDYTTGIYSITLINPNQQVTFKAYPVFEDKDYTAAMNTYKRKIREEQAKLYGSDTLKFQAASRIKGLQKNIALNDTDNFVAANIYRSFAVGKTGLWSYSRISNKPLGANINVDFKDATGNTLNLKYVAILDKTHNIIMRYTPAEFKSIRFNAASQNELIAITNDNNFAYMKKDDFAKLPTSGNCKVVLQISSKKPVSAEEIIKLTS
jgi:hypothetical protein